MTNPPHDDRESDESGNQPPVPPSGPTSDSTRIIGTGNVPSAPEGNDPLAKSDQPPTYGSPSDDSATRVVSTNQYGSTPPTSGNDPLSKEQPPSYDQTQIAPGQNYGTPPPAYGTTPGDATQIAPAGYGTTPPGSSYGDTSQPGYGDTSQPGYGAADQGYGAAGQGYGVPGQEYGSPGQGYPAYGQPAGTDPYGQPGYPPAQPYGGGVPVAPKTNPLAIASLVSSIFGFFCCGVLSVVGIALGFVAKNQISSSNGAETGEGMALAGIIVGAISLIVGVLVAILYGTGAILSNT